MTRMRAVWRELIQSNDIIMVFGKKKKKKKKKEKIIHTKFISIINLPNKPLQVFRSTFLNI